MTRISGRGVTVGVGRESTRGTAVAPTVGIPNLGISFQEKVDKISNNSNLGVIDKESGRDITRKYGQGSINGKVQLNTFGYFVMAALGQQPTTALHSGETTVWDNTFARANNNQHQSLTIATHQANEDLRFPLAMIDNFKITIPINDYVQWSADFLSAKPTATANTITFNDEPEFIARQLTVKTATNLAGLAGASAETDITALDFTIKKNLEAIYTLGNDTPVDILNTSFEVNGEMTLFYNGATWKTLANANTYKALQVDAANADSQIGVVPTSPEMRVRFAKVNFDFPDYAFDLDKTMTQKVKFNPVFDLTSASTIDFLLVNTTNGYAA